MLVEQGDERAKAVPGGGREPGAIARDRRDRPGAPRGIEQAERIVEGRNLAAGVEDHRDLPVLVVVQLLAAVAIGRSTCAAVLDDSAGLGQTAEQVEPGPSRLRPGRGEQPVGARQRFVVRLVEEQREHALAEVVGLARQERLQPGRLVGRDAGFRQAFDGRLADRGAGVGRELQQQFASLAAVRVRLEQALDDPRPVPGLHRGHVCDEPHRRSGADALEQGPAHGAAVGRNHLPGPDDRSKLGRLLRQASDQALGLLEER